MSHNLLEVDRRTRLFKKQPIRLGMHTACATCQYALRMKCRHVAKEYDGDNLVACTGYKSAITEFIT